MKKGLSLLWILSLVIAWKIGSRANRYEEASRSISQNVENHEACFPEHKHESFDGLFSRLKSLDAKSDEFDRGLAYLKIARMLPSLEERDLLALFEHDPAFVFKKGDRLLKEQKHAIERQLLTSFDEPEKVKEFFASDLLVNMAGFHPLSSNFLKTLLSHNDVTGNQKLTVFYNELVGRHRVGEDLQSLADLIVKETQGDQRNSMLNIYHERLADIDPGLALDSYLNLQKKRILIDDFGNQAGVIVSVAAHKNLEKAIDLVNENFNRLIGFEQSVGTNLALVIADKHRNEIFQHVRRLSSSKIQKHIVYSIYVDLQRDIASEKFKDFNEQLSAFPQLQDYVLSSLNK